MRRGSLPWWGAIRMMGVLVLIALMAGCSAGGLLPGHATMQQALGDGNGQRVTVVYQEPFDESRVMVLFRTMTHDGLTAALLERNTFGRWSRTGAMLQNKQLPNMGALTYGRGTLGYVEEQGSVGIEAVAIFGEILDPSITWVELTLHEEGAVPVRATVRDGLWVVQVPPEKDTTGFTVRAGNPDGLRFLAAVHSNPPRDIPPLNAPLVEYLSGQMGIRLAYPETAGTPQIDAAGRLVIGTKDWAILVDRQPRTDNPILEPAGEKVIDQGAVPLGGREATYLLEAFPEEVEGTFTYYARYLVQTESDQYELVCATAQVYRHEYWADHLKPLCDKILGTVEFIPQ